MNTNVLTVWWTVVLALLTAATPGTARVPAGPAGAVGAAPPAGCAGVVGTAARCWPVAGAGPGGRPRVLRAFEPPPTPWAAGHRGVDLVAGPGAPVRAAAAGEVAFAGAVGGVGVVVVRHAGGLRTTYEPVRATAAVGTRVAAGVRVGLAAGGGLAHCPGPCLHWGLLDRGGGYLDPLTFLPSALRRSGPSRLLPLGGPPGAAEAGVPAAPGGPAYRPVVPRRAMATAASTMAPGCSAAPRSIRRTAASTMPWRSIAVSRGSG